MPRDKSLQVITVRVPPETLKRLPRPSLAGRRAEFIRQAIEEKLERDRVNANRERAIDAALQEGQA